MEPRCRARSARTTTKTAAARHLASQPIPASTRPASQSRSCAALPAKDFRNVEAACSCTAPGPSSTVPPSRSPTTSRRRSPPPSSLFTAALVRGTVSGTVNGSATSGVQYARLYVNGAQVAQQQLACDFTQPAPCPATSSNQFDLDTTALANGPHQIQTAVVDAAGNQTLGSPVQIIVDNTNPAAPSDLLVNGKGAAAWINTPATISWTNPSQPENDPIGQINWIACAGDQASIPTSGCEAAQRQAGPLSSLTFSPSQAPRSQANRKAATPSSYGCRTRSATHRKPTLPRSASAFRRARHPLRPRSPPAAPGRTRSRSAPLPHLAPLTATNWIACKGPTSCTATQTSPGLSFLFDPDHTPQFQRSPYGPYTIRAWLQDAAGNASPANSAILAITHSKPGKASPHLHILSVTSRTRPGAARAPGGRQDADRARHDRCPLHARRALAQRPEDRSGRSREVDRRDRTSRRCADRSRDSRPSQHRGMALSDGDSPRASWTHRQIGAEDGRQRMAGTSHPEGSDGLHLWLYLKRRVRMDDRTQTPSWTRQRRPCRGHGIGWGETRGLPRRVAMSRRFLAQP